MCASIGDLIDVKTLNECTKKTHQSSLPQWHTIATCSSRHSDIVIEPSFVFEQGGTMVYHGIADRFSYVDQIFPYEFKLRNLWPQTLYRDLHFSQANPEMKSKSNIL